MSRKVIISAAITGSIHTPTMSPYLPITPEEIAGQAVEAARAGAAAVHIHARNPENGMPSPDLDLFREIVGKIRSESDVIICITTGGGTGMTVDQRAAPVPEFKPELASFNMGSINFALFPVIKRYKEWKYDWEKPFLEGSKARGSHKDSEAWEVDDGSQRCQACGGGGRGRHGAFHRPCFCPKYFIG